MVRGVHPTRCTNHVPKVHCFTRRLCISSQLFSVTNSQPTTPFSLQKTSLEKRKKKNGVNQICSHSSLSLSLPSTMSEDKPTMQTAKDMKPRGSTASGENSAEWIDKARMAVKVRSKLKGKMSMEDFVAPGQLLQLEQIFKDHPGQELDEEEFIKAFGNVMGEDLRPEDLRLWFMRVDANANGSVDWDEFSSHLLYQHHGTIDNPRSREYVQGTLQAEARVNRHHKQPVCCVKVNERTGSYWSVSVDGIVKVWTPSSLKQTHTINNNLSLANVRANTPVMATDLCFGNANHNTYVATVDKTINMYNSRNQHVKRYVGRKLVNELKGEGGSVGDAEKAKAAAEEAGVGVQKVETIALLHMEEPAYAMTTVPVGDKEFLLTGLNSGQLFAYPLLRQQPPSLTPVQKVNAHTGTITGVVHIPHLQGLTVITGSWDKTLRLIDVESNSILETIGAGYNKHAVCCIDWNRDSKLLVSSGPEREINLWNPFISTPLATLTGHLTNVVGVTFNPIDHQLISMSTDKCVKVWDLRTLKLFQSFIDESDAASPVDKGYTALTYDMKLNRIVAAGTRVQAWPIRRSIPKFTADYKGHTETLVAVLYTECFGQVVTIDHGGCVQVWNSSTGERDFLFSFLGNSGTFSDRPHPTCACFDAYQRRVFIGDSNGVLRAFNYANGQEIKAIPIVEGSAVSHVLHCAKLTDDVIVASGYRYVVATTGCMLYIASDGDAKEERKQHSLRCSYGHIATLASNPTLKTPLVIVGTQDGTLVLFNVFLAIEVAVFSKTRTASPTHFSQSPAGHSRCPSIAKTFVTSPEVIEEAQEEVILENSHALLSPNLRHDPGNVYHCGDSSTGSEGSDEEILTKLVGSPKNGAKKDSRKGVDGLVWLHTSGVIATVAGATRIDFWSVRTQQLLFSYKANLSKMGCFMLIETNPLCDILAVCDDVGTAYIFDVSTVKAATREEELHHHQNQSLPQEQCGECLLRAAFAVHTGNIISAALVGFPSLASGQRLAWNEGYIATCGADLLVTLHTLDGRLVGQFGRKQWSLGMPSTWLNEHTLHLPPPSRKSPVASPTKRHETRPKEMNKPMPVSARTDTEEKRSVAFAPPSTALGDLLHCAAEEAGWEGNTGDGFSCVTLGSQQKQKKYRHPRLRKEEGEQMHLKETPSGASPNVFNTNRATYRLAPLRVTARCILRSQNPTKDSGLGNVTPASGVSTHAEEQEWIPALSEPIPTSDGVVEERKEKEGEALGAGSMSMSHARIDPNGEPVTSEMSRAIQQQKQIHPKDWVTRAVGLLPLKGRPGFHKVAHPNTIWSPPMQQLCQRKSRKAEGRK